MTPTDSGFSIVKQVFDLDQASRPPVRNQRTWVVTDLEDVRYVEAKRRFIQFVLSEVVWETISACVFNRREIIEPLRQRTFQSKHLCVAKKVSVQMLNRRLRPDEDSHFCFVRGVEMRRKCLTPEGMSALVRAKHISDLNAWLTVCWVALLIFHSYVVNSGNNGAR
jgi:hypothetical protein